MSTHKKNTKAKIRLSFIAAIISIGFFVLITYRNMVLTESESRHINASVEKLLRQESLLKDLQDIETGQRGFIITGEEKFLEYYYNGLDNLRNDTVAIKQLNEGNEFLQGEQETLMKLINQKVTFSKYAVELRRLFGYNSAASYIQNEEGLKLMQEIRQQISFLENRDRQSLAKANRNRELLSQKRSWQLFSLAVIFYIILFINYRVISSDFDKQLRSERLLKYNASLIGIISDAVITTDKEYKITNWNKFAEQMYGYTEEEVLGMTIRDALQVDFENYSIDGIMQTFNDTDNWRGEVIHYTKSREPLNVDVAVSVIRDVDGNNVGTVSVVRNVTERHKTEKRLKQLTTHLEEEVKIKAQELNAVFERITDAFIALDNKWQYTYINKKAAELHGKPADELIGKVIWDEFPDVVSEPFYHALIEAKETQQSSRRELYFSKSDKWYEDLIYPSADGISVYYHDISKRKQAEQQILDSERELKISNERFLLVSKATNDAVWDWDMIHDTIWGNESFCSIFNLSNDERISFSEYIGRLHETDKETVLLNLKNALDSKKTYLTEEFRFKTTDGQFRYFFDRAYVLYNEDGRAYRMLGAMQDITQQKLAQSEILKEKELSDSIINSLPGIFYVLNRDGVFYRWNRNFELVTGYSPEEIETKSAMDFFKESQKDMMRAKIANVFMYGEDRVEADFVAKDGSSTPFYFTGMIINYEGENCIMGVGIDISEKVKSQQELKESEEKYRTLIEQASDGIFISNKDGFYQDVNTSATNLTGYSKNELLGLNIRDILFADEDNHSGRMIEGILQGDMVVTECLIRQKNGAFIHVEISAKMLPDGRYQGIVRDISTRKKAEEAIRLSEHKYRLLFDQNPMPMSMVSLPERKFIDVNVAAIEFYGYSKEEFLQMSINDLRPEEERSASSYMSSFSSGISNTGIWRHRKKDGALVKVNIITHDIIYEGKQVKLLLANDVTEKIMAEERLKKSHEDLRQLATHLQDIREDERTHIAREIHDELGQQLTGLKMDISWLSKKVNSPNEEINIKLAEALALIDETVKTVRRIATQLRPSILDDLGLVSAMEWQSEEFEKRFDIKTVFHTGLGNVDLDKEIATGIFRIFQECLTNVLRHSKATEVKALLTAGNGVLRLMVSDNGVGFNADDIEHKKTLGLLGMKERTLMMGGTYDITSKHGEGTTVNITVPIDNM